MGIYFDFRKRLMMEFESIAGRRVELSELVFGERHDAPSGSGYDSLIDVTWGAITRGFVYNRTPLNKVLLNLDKVPVAVDLGEGLPSPERFVKGILDTYDVDLDPRYFDFHTPPVGRGPTKIVALANNPIYTGEAYVVTKTALVPGVYRKPDHEWLLEGNTVDTGSAEQNMPGEWESLVVDGKVFMRPAANLTFGTAMGMRVDGDFTLDFEMSYAPGAGYAAFFGVPAWDSRGAFTIYGGKIYHYLVTPTGGGAGVEWSNKIPTSDGTPIRFTIVSIGGMEHWYVNGQYLNFTHAALPESNYYFLQYLAKGAWLRNLRYWKLGLFNPELSSLFNQPAPASAFPDHWFPFAGNGFNKGLNSNWFPGTMGYPLFEDKTWGQPSAAGATMGLTVDLTQPFTIQLDLVNHTGVFGATEGLFSDSSTGASGGALRFHSGDLMYVTGSARFNTSQLFVGKRPRRLTLQGDGTNFTAWVDDIFVGSVTVGTKTTLSVLGLAGVALSTNWMLKDLKIWTRKVPLADLRVFSELPKLDEWQSVTGLESRGSNVQLIDGNFGTVFNAQYDPMATGSFGADSHGRYIMAMYYYFAIDGVNFKKKIVNFYIDVVENGNWVNKATGRTYYVSQSFPGRDVVQLSNPVYINPADPRIRIRTSGHWGDPYGYRWCTELVFLTSDPTALTPPEPEPTPSPIRKPAFHYSFAGGSLASDGSDATPLTLPVASHRVVGNDTLVKLSATTGINIGVDLPVAGDFTMMFKVVLASLPNYFTLFVGSPAMMASTGAMMFYHGQPFQAGMGWDAAVNPVAPLVVGQVADLTIRSKAGTIEIWCDGVKIHTHANPGNLTPYRYIGDAAGYSSQWSTTNELGRIAYWYEALPDDELALAFSGTPLV